MNVPELFNLGNEFYNEGRVETAMEIWNRVVRSDPNFGPVHLQMHNVYTSQNNPVKALECMIRFTNCPLTINTQGSGPAILQRIEELKKQLNPQPPPK